MTGRLFGIVVILAMMPAWPAWAQSVPLAEARRLFEAAAYEEALAALASVEVSGQVAAGRDQALLRALSLVALGREDEARAAMRVATDLDPAFVLDPSMAAPRVCEMYDEVRQSRVPELIRARYGGAREALAAREYARAAEGFAAVQALIDTTRSTLPEAEGARLAELHELATGFLDLSREALAIEQRKAEVEEAASTGPAVPSDVDSDGDRAAAPAGSPPPGSNSGSEPPASNPTSADRITPASARSDIVPPVALAQPMPDTWGVPGLGLGETYQGVIEIDIDEDGTVTAARIVKPVSPLLDIRLLQAARRWRYRPATFGGVPVKYTREVVINLQVKE
ncbi:MAG: energy transducer TonB [Acidobacteria bacterium]|nr:energy transducer TonB [Acidobacteriota bacterium]